MHALADIYAHALLRTTTDAATSVKRLVELLERRGHRALMPHIVRAFDRHVSKLQKTGAQVFVASPTDVSALQDSIDARKASVGIGQGEAVATVVNEHLIGGFMIRKGDRQLDATHRRHLTELYRRLISA